MDNKNTFIAIGAMLILLCLIFACANSGNKSEKLNIYMPKSQKQVTSKPDHNRDEETYNYGRSGSGSYSSGSGSSGSYYSSDEDSATPPPALLSEEDKTKMLKKRKAERVKLREAAIEWLKHKTNDPSLCQATIEKYKIKSDQNFTNGTVALRQKDYKKAILCFTDVTKDQNASPVTKYFAMSNLMTIAQQMKDIELYFIAARMNAALCATEDLSVLGIEKSTHQLEWIEKVEKSIKARDNHQAFEECVQLKLNKYKGGINREEAEQEVKEDIEYYTGLYREMLE